MKKTAENDTLSSAQVVMLDFGTTFRDGQRQMLHLARRLLHDSQESGADPLSVTVACPRSTPLAKAADVPVLPFAGTYGHGLWLLKLFPLLRRPGTVLHAHGWEAAKAARLCRLFLPRLPVVITFRGTVLLRREPSLWNARQLRSLCACTRFAVCATAELGHVLEKYGLDEARLKVCLPGMVSEHGTPSPDGRLVFLAADALVPDSGLSDLVDAMSLVNGMENLPPWEVRIVGRGPQFDELLEKARSLGVESRLALLGPQDVEEQMEFCHVALSVARRSREQFLFMLRAWARGLPLVATATPEMTEYVVDKQQARLVPPGNAVALGAAMVRCLNDAELRQRVGTGGSTALLAHTPDSVAAQMRGLYANALESTPHPQS